MVKSGPSESNLATEQLKSTTAQLERRKTMFRGNHPARVDEKGRLKLPADFKSLLEPDAEGKFTFYITSKDGERAEVWPIRAWEAVEAKLAEIPSTNPAKRRFSGRDELLRPDGGDGRTRTCAAAADPAGTRHSWWRRLWCLGRRRFWR